jgi:hypothetical protein
LRITRHLSFPGPYVGLVIRYSYLWKREFDSGREEGTQDRPCAIVMTVVDEDGDKEVLVLPVTHSPPDDPADAIEIPPATKNRLGLDGERSWIMITEVVSMAGSYVTKTQPARDPGMNAVSRVTTTQTDQCRWQRRAPEAFATDLVGFGVKLATATVS